MAATFSAHSQQLSLDSLYSRDSDEIRVFANTLTAWRHSVPTRDTQVMSWYTTLDIDLDNPEPGQLRLNLQPDSPAAAVTLLPDVDFTGAAVKARVRVAHWADLSGLTLVFGSDGIAATKTVTLDLKSRLADPTDGEWIEVVVRVSELERYNDVDVSRINFAMIRAQGRPGNHVDIGTVSLLRPADDRAAGREVKIFDPRFDVTRKIVRNAAGVAPLFNYGAQLTRLDVENDAGDSRHATDARLLASAAFGRVQLAGSIGVLNSESDTTVGSAEAVWQAAEPLVLSLGHARNAIDTVEALQDDVVQDAFTFAADYNAAKWGAYASVAEIDYSDGNDRSMLTTKIHASVWERAGTSVYIRTRHYNNSDPYSPYYYSPETYGRWLAGASSRVRAGPNLVLSGHLDVGRQKADGESDLGWTTQLRLESRPSKAWTFKATMGIDQTRPDYRYKYIMGYIVYQ